MAKQRRTLTYALYEGRKKVCIGTTDDLQRREQQHRDDGIHFTRIEPASRRMTEEGAKKREAEQLQSYRRGHGGNNPRYNEDCDG